MRTIITLPLIALAAAFMWVGSAQADTVASNLGPGSSYDITDSWAVAGPSNYLSLPPLSTAIPFTSSETVTLSELLVPLNFGGPFVSPSTGGVEISIATNDSGLPGVALESWTVDVPEGNQLFSFSDASSLLLTAGTTYWITASASEPTTFAGWNFNSTGEDSGSVAFDEGSGWFLYDITGTQCGPEPCALPAFEVTGTPVVTPEPSSLALLGMGVLGVVCTFRRRAPVHQS